MDDLDQSAIANTVGLLTGPGAFYLRSDVNDLDSESCLVTMGSPLHSGDGLGGLSPGDSHAITARTLSRMVLPAC